MTAEEMETGPGPEPPEGIHGPNAFVKGYCTCAYCRALRRQSQARYRAQRIADYKAGRRFPAKHDYSTYVGWECRCDVCTASWLAYRAARRADGKPG